MVALTQQCQDAITSGESNAERARTRARGLEEVRTTKLSPLSDLLSRYLCTLYHLFHIGVCLFLSLFFPDSLSQWLPFFALFCFREIERCGC